MLVISRKIDESIFIGDNVKVKIIKVDRNKVRLGIIAPDDIRVLREEIYPKPSDPTEDILPDLKL